MDFFQQAGHLFAGAGLLFSSFLGNHAAVLGQSTGPTITKQNFSSNNFYKVNKDVSYEGYNVKVSIAVPKNGGEIHGGLSGDCNGKLSGNYAGGNNGAINGQLNGNCQALFLQVPISLTFNGTVNTITRTAPVNVTINVDNLRKTEPVTLSFN